MNFHFISKSMDGINMAYHKWWQDGKKKGYQSTECPATGVQGGTPCHTESYADDEFSDSMSWSKS